ncbi:hypothetical protein AMTRI_Chr03g50100 [Amborella trichopoda]
MSIYVMYRGPIVPVLDPKTARLSQSKHCVRNNIGTQLHYDVIRRPFHTKTHSQIKSELSNQANEEESQCR